MGGSACLPISEPGGEVETMLRYPDIDPVIFSIGSIDVRWYGLFYVIAFIAGHFFIKRNLRAGNVRMPADQYDTLFIFIILGVMIGGRLGYILFYDTGVLLHNPLRIFAIREGGMSFHGGAAGVLAAGILFVRKYRLRFYPLADAIVPFAALGLGLGRIGNFINAELYGRVTEVPWGMVFPGTDGRPRHPSQLYQALTDGFILFIILQMLYRKRPRDGVVFWAFIGLYGVSRFIIEFFREPDPQLGFVLFNFTMGQLLSSFMIAGSIIGMYHVIHRRR
jgi:phosphatidylglycerol---prolipoprotein diacylglyceryl transferase